MSNLMRIEPFSAISLADEFFDSLKEDYPGFDRWFQKKADTGDVAYVTRDELGAIDGFLYLKSEVGVVDDVRPALPSAKRVKIGTFKIEQRGTKYGERFLKKAFDLAIRDNVEEIYVTVFAKHEGLTGYLIDTALSNARRNHRPPVILSRC